MSNTDLLSSEAADGASQAGGPKDDAGRSGQQDSGSKHSEAADSTGNTTPRRRGGLSGMVMPELRQLAGELGINTRGMRKGDLIAAIRERQGGKNGQGGTAPADGGGGDSAKKQPTLEDSAAANDANAAPQRERSEPARGGNGSRPERNDGPHSGGSTVNGSEASGKTVPDEEQTEQGRNRRAAGGQSGEEDGNRRSNNRRRRPAHRGGDQSGNQSGGETSERGGQDNRGGQDTRSRGSQDTRGSQDNRGGQDTRGGQDNRGGQDTRSRGGRDQSGNGENRGGRTSETDGDDDAGGGRRRGRRFRDRRRNRGRGDGGGGEPEIREDDVLLPVAGILDVLENYAFVRTSGYLPGPEDVYVSLSLVRKYGLRRGDAIQGAVRQPREGEQQRQKFNPLVRVDAVNGLAADESKKRSEFHKLTPLYPNDRLRLENEQNDITGRIVDLVMPVGKGQRALIVSPPKAGKTTVLQSIANAITANNPECHLMVVLVDERPEEVTDMQRSVDGEVIAATFDRPASEHTTLAELAIERAKRLTEMGHDVVVLLESLTRLGRSYNLSAPASGRILSGGVDSTALYPPKRFLGAARNIENGGSLTIFATALVETGSTMDTVIFEEFKGTGNAELKLDRKLADKRLFPAVDVDASSTRKEELLMSSDELAVTHKLRRVLAALDSQQALELLQDRLRKTQTNIEFLMTVAKNTPGKEEE